MSVRTDGSDPFGRRELDELTGPRPSACASLYLPTHRAGADVKQDPLRYRNLLAAAEAELTTRGNDPRDAEELLAPARELLEDREFWRFQADGLAVFIESGGFQTYRTAISFEELAVVSTQFHLRPLLPLVVGDEDFWLLALSQRSVKLFRATRHTVAEVDIGDTPTSMAEALAHEDRQKALQVMSSGPTGTGLYHGHGGGSEDDKAALERYFRAVDRGLNEILVDSSAPLVVAGVAYYGPIYRDVSNYRHIVAAVAAGNPEELSATDLHARAWPLIDAELTARHKALPDRYEHQRAHDRAVEGLADVRTAATEGRVDVLLIPRDIRRWAAHRDADPDDAHETRQAGDLDLLDDIAQRVLETGGDVLVVEDHEMPGGGVIAALLRYPQPVAPSRS